ncbi:MAG: relaxase/mobilization nuclease domain-containing protein, partial [Gammaproteobacteria bacterium]
MILKGNQRAGGRQMAIHLLNGEQNEHVNVHEVRGFMAGNVLGALNEAYALSKGTQCKQFMYSLSLNPPQDEKVSIQTFEETLDRVEKKLGLEGQPRVVVFHEKEGRRHAHAVWSRIDTTQMKAINIAFPKRKLNDISKSLYLEHGWQLPEGFKNKDKKNPLNYTRSEWQQAARIGRRPADIKRELQENWSASDSKKSFMNALRESGYSLAWGDRRGYVAVDL